MIHDGVPCGADDLNGAGQLIMSFARAASNDTNFRPEMPN